MIQNYFFQTKIHPTIGKSCRRGRSRRARTAKNSFSFLVFSFYNIKVAEFFVSIFYRFTLLRQEVLLNGNLIFGSVKNVWQIAGLHFLKRFYGFTCQAVG